MPLPSKKEARPDFQKIGSPRRKVKEASLLRPISRDSTLSARIFAELRECLISGKLLPGEKLPLRKLATELNVSIMPVREAVTRLVADGALEVLPNRAVRVPTMTCAKLRELTIIRVMIEGFAVEQAALNRSKSELDAIKALDQAFRERVNHVGRDGSLALSLNKEFHFKIYAAAGLPTLVSIIEALWLKIGPVINLDLSSAKRLSTGIAAAHHGRIVHALVTRDPVKARAALAADIGDAAKYIEATGELPVS